MKKERRKQNRKGKNGRKKLRRVCGWISGGELRTREKQLAKREKSRPGGTGRRAAGMVSDLAGGYRQAGVWVVGAAMRSRVAVVGMRPRVRLSV